MDGVSVDGNSALLQQINKYFGTRSQNISGWIWMGLEYNKYDKIFCCGRHIVCLLFMVSLCIWYPYGSRVYVQVHIRTYHACIPPACTSPRKNFGDKPLVKNTVWVSYHLHLPLDDMTHRLHNVWSHPKTYVAVQIYYPALCPTIFLSLGSLGGKKWKGGGTGGKHAYIQFLLLEYFVWSAIKIRHGVLSLGRRINASLCFLLSWFLFCTYLSRKTSSSWIGQAFRSDLVFSLYFASTSSWRCNGQVTHPSFSSFIHIITSRALLYSCARCI